MNIYIIMKILSSSSNPRNNIWNMNLSHIILFLDIFFILIKNSGFLINYWIFKIILLS